MADPLTMLLSCLYGFFMGSYPVPIKARSVLAANVHPLIFQGYKSTIVCVTGLLFFIPIWARDDAVHLSWWGVASAAAWVPSGFCTIAAVPLIGLSFAIVITCASSSILSFLVFWLVLGEKVHSHQLCIGGHCHTVYLAPLYVTATVLGMVALIYAPQLQCARPRGGESVTALLDGTTSSSSSEEDPGKGADTAEVDAVGGQEDSRGSNDILISASKNVRAKSAGRFILGIISAFFSGFFSAVQYGLVSLDAPSTCPSFINQQFDPFHSWMISFGLGALAVTTTLILALFTVKTCQGLPRPSFELRVMAVPGSIAGLCWSIANFFGTLAVTRGGQAITMAQMQSVQLITSGAWGIVWYRELRGRQAAVWCIAALWTLGSIVLLCQEKA